MTKSAFDDLVEKLNSEFKKVRLEVRFLNEGLRHLESALTINPPAKTPGPGPPSKQPPPPSAAKALASLTALDERFQRAYTRLSNEVRDLPKNLPAKESSARCLVDWEQARKIKHAFTKAKTRCHRNGEKLHHIWGEFVTGERSNKDDIDENVWGGLKRLCEDWENIRRHVEYLSVHALTKAETAEEKTPSPEQQQVITAQRGVARGRSPARMVEIGAPKKHLAPPPRHRSPSHKVALAHPPQQPAPMPSPRHVAAVALPQNIIRRPSPSHKPALFPSQMHVPRQPTPKKTPAHITPSQTKTPQRPPPSSRRSPKPPGPPKKSPPETLPQPKAKPQTPYTGNRPLHKRVPPVTASTMEMLVNPHVDPRPVPIPERDPSRPKKKIAWRANASIINPSSREPVMKISSMDKPRPVQRRRSMEEAEEDMGSKKVGPGTGQGFLHGLKKKISGHFGGEE